MNINIFGYNYLQVKRIFVSVHHLLESYIKLYLDLQNEV